MKMISLSMVILFLFNIMVYGLTPSPRMANTIIVAKSGGDYTTIQAAVNAATSGTTILVYPGTYAEQVIISKNLTPANISLIGTDNINCRIVKSVQGSGGVPSGWLVAIWGSGKVKNLYIENTYVGYASTAVGTAYGGEISNCNLKSAGQDTVVLRPGLGYSTLLENCNIENSVTGSVGDTISINSLTASTAECIIRNCKTINTGVPYALWLGAAGGDYNCRFYNCSFITKATGGNSSIRINDPSHNIVARFFNCQFLEIDGLTPQRLVADESYGSHTTIYLQNCVYASLGEPDCTYNTIIQH